MKKKLFTVLLALALVLSAMAFTAMATEEAPNVQAQYTVMSQNIKQAHIHENNSTAPEDGNYVIPLERYKQLYSTVEAVMPDVLALQECDWLWHDDLIDNVTGNGQSLGVQPLSALGYEAAVYDNADKWIANNRNPLYYKANKLDVVAKGYVCYEGYEDQLETPWCFTWAVFAAEGGTEPLFAVSSTHIVSYVDGQIDYSARAAQIAQLVAYMKEVETTYGVPVILMGDYNTDPTTSPYAAFELGTKLLSARDTATVMVGSGYETFNTLGSKPNATNESLSGVIDHCMISPTGIVADRYELMLEEVAQDLYTYTYSDHVAHKVTFHLTDMDHVHEYTQQAVKDVNDDARHLVSCVCGAVMRMNHNLAADDAGNMVCTECGVERQVIAQCVCAGTKPAGHTCQTQWFYPWTRTDALPVTSGYYYLTDHVVLTGRQDINNNDQNIVLDLKGRTVTGLQDQRMYCMYGTGTKLTITDSGKDGSLKALGTNGGQGGVLWIRNAAEVTIYGGIIDASGFTTGNGLGGAAICVEDTSKVTMYGGTIKGGTTTNGGGAAVSVRSNAQFTMKNGTIDGGTNNGGGHGGAVYVGGNGVFTMDDGLIQNGVAPHGANVKIEGNAKFVINHGVIKGGTASGTAAAIRIDGSAAFTMTGGIIADVEGDANGRGIFVNSTTAQMTLSGGEICTPIWCNSVGKITLSGDIKITETVHGLRLPGSYTALELDKLGQDALVYMRLDTVSNKRIGTAVNNTVGADIFGKLKIASADIHTGAVGVYNTDAVYAQGKWEDRGGCECGETIPDGTVLADGTIHRCTWRTWTQVKDTITAANYENKDIALRLTGDVSMTGQLGIKKNCEVYVDLNGYTLTRNNGPRVFALNVSDGSTLLTITDSAGGGMVKVASGEGTAQGTGIWANGNNTTYSTKTILYAGTLDASAYSLTSMRGNAVDMEKGAQFVMYGGTVNGGTASAEGAGSAIYAQVNGQVSICGGTVNGAAGSAIGQNSTGQFVMYGGTVNGGTTKGGAIYMTTGTFQMKGGIINGGKNGKQGNAIYLKSDSCALVMENATINGGTGEGAVYLNGGSVTMNEGAVINGGTGTGHGGAVRMQGSNTRFTMNADAIIENGNAPHGGNVKIEHGTFTMNGGQIRNGTSSSTGANIRMDNDAKLIINGGVISNVEGTSGTRAIFINGGSTSFSMTGGEIQAPVWCNSIGSVYLSGTAKLTDQVYGLRLPDVSGGYTVTAGVLTEGACVNLRTWYNGHGSVIAVAEDGFTGAQYIHNMSNSNLKAAIKEGNVVWTGIRVGDTAYATLEEAADASNGDWVKLFIHVSENTTVGSDLYLDLAGYNVNGTLTMTDGATLYCIDSNTDDYDCSDGYGKIKAIEGNVAPDYSAKLDGESRRYVKIAQEDGISFHRIYVGITHMSIKPASAGVGYKAVFAGDDVVKDYMSDFGYNLQLDGGKQITCQKEGSAFVAGQQTLTLRVANYDICNYGETKLNANVFMVIDGQVISSQIASYSLRDMLERVNDNVTAFSVTQIAALLEMIAPYKDNVMAQWDISNIK